MMTEPQAGAVKVDSKGRIVLPPSIRDELEIDTGDILSLKRTRDGLVLVPARKSDFLSRFKQVIETPPPRRGRPENWPPSKMKSIWKKA